MREREEKLLQQFFYINFTEEQCVRRLCFSKDVVTELCHLLQPNLEPQTRVRTALSVAVNGSIAHNFCANGSFQSATGDISNIFQFAVHRSICEVTDALHRRRRDCISFPMTREKQHKRACGFVRIAGSPMMQGAIDCTQVALILTVNAHFPSSSHDVFILCQICVPAQFQPPHQPHGWLLGDKGYPLSTWLMTPLYNPNIPGQLSYNESHAATRNIIEQTIGVLKQRFRCLDHSGGALQYSVEWGSLFIVICCMLHNLAIMRTQPLPPDIAAPPQEEEQRRRRSRRRSKRSMRMRRTRRSRNTSNIGGSHSIAILQGRSATVLSDFGSSEFHPTSRFLWMSQSPHPFALPYQSHKSEMRDNSKDETFQ
uniref:putative nuclease HARBI1 n=1 Tax=Pristiophorus japonicus TaxID=55135 RepID=UPI00398ECE6C